MNEMNSINRRDLYICPSQGSRMEKFFIVPILVQVMNLNLMSFPVIVSILTLKINTVLVSVSFTKFSRPSFRIPFRSPFQEIAFQQLPVYFPFHHSFCSKLYYFHVSITKTIRKRFLNDNAIFFNNWEFELSKKKVFWFKSQKNT